MLREFSLYYPYFPIGNVLNNSIKHKTITATHNGALLIAAAIAQIKAAKARTINTVIINTFFVKYNILQLYKTNINISYNQSFYRSFSFFNKHFILLSIYISDRKIFIERTNIMPTPIPIIVGQTSVPKAYIGSYLTIGLQSLIVATTDTYPGIFTLTVAPGKNYTITSSTDTTTVVNFTGDSTVTSILVQLTVKDGNVPSTPYNYQVTIVPAPKSSKPVSYSINTATATKI
jgi:hypothetical protein